MQFVRLSTTLLKDEESARNFLLVTLPHIHRFKKNFTDRLSNKPFLIRLLTTPPRLKYVASLPCNLSWIACFLTLMFHNVVWQHRQSVVEFLTITLLQNYDGIFQWKKWKSVKIYKTMAMSLWPHFVGLPCLLASVTGHWSRGPDISPPATSPPGHEPAGHEPVGHEPAIGGSQARQRWVKSLPNHELVLPGTGKI